MIGNNSLIHKKEMSSVRFVNGGLPLTNFLDLWNSDWMEIDFVKFSFWQLQSYQEGLVLWLRGLKEEKYLIAMKTKQLKFLLV